MHIPDGFLSTPVWATLDLLSLPGRRLDGAPRANRRSGDPDTLGDRKVPLMGVMGAFVFAAQMINFPIPLGTSAHLVGGALMAIVLGPAAASVVMTAILVIQAFVFQDGGIMALGANVVNMALIGVLAGIRSLSFVGRELALRGDLHERDVQRAGQRMLRSVRTARSPACPCRTRLVSISLGLFLVSALTEGAITLAAVRAIERLNPAIATAARAATGRIAIDRRRGDRRGAAGHGGSSGGVRRARESRALGRTVWDLRARPVWLHAPLADYEWQGSAPLWLRRASAGIAGLALIYGICALTGAGSDAPKERLTCTTSWSRAGAGREPVCTAATPAASSPR